MARTALVTGGAKRLGAASCQTLHQAGFDLVVHYHHSKKEAEALVASLNQARPGSAIALAADLSDPEAVRRLAADCLDWQQRLDLLVNNASCFYPTPLADASDDDWQQLIGTNLRAPFILCQQLAAALTASQGCIINMADIYAEKPLQGHPLYSIAKAGLVTLTQSLARELAPEVRVNAISPGVILPPADAAQRLQELIDSVPLERAGKPEDITSTLLWLATESPYITGQVIRVDGGRALSFIGG